VHFSTLKIAWRNLGRNRKRTALAVAAIALGQFTLVFVNCMMAGMYADMLEALTGPLVGHAQVHHPEWREEQALDLTIDDLSVAREEIGSLPGVSRVSPRVYAPALAAPGAKTDSPATAEPAMLVGVDVAVESQRNGLLAELSPDERPSGREVVLGRVLAQRLKLSPGDSLAVIGADADGFPASGLFTVRAVMRSSASIVNRLGIVADLGVAQAFVELDDAAHELIIVGEDPHAAEALAERVGRVKAVSGMETLSWMKAVPIFETFFNMKDWFDMIFVAILFVAAAAGIVNTMMMSTFERTREFGMLLSLGASPWRIVRMILYESVMLGLAGVAIGSALGTAVVLLTGHYGFDYGWFSGITEQEFTIQGLSMTSVMYPMFELKQVLLGVYAVTITAVLAAVWPALIVTRLEPAEAIRS
jgi:ABC-type lipoprotein release transport system permease subunit